MTELDARLLRFVYAADSGGLTVLALALSALGSGWVMLAMIPLLRWPHWRPVVYVLTMTLAATAGLVSLIKAIVARPRPCVAFAEVHALCAPPTDPSFPSGHACGGFAFAAFAVVMMYTGHEVRARVRLALALAVVTLAVGIAWSRVYLGVHFPGDVIAGGILGAAGGAVAAYLYRRRARGSTR